MKVIKQAELLGQQFTVYGTAEEPLFRANEVATIIGHSNITKMLEMVDDDEKGVNQLLTPGGYQQVSFITESGLYEILMQSRKPIAKQFKKGVKAILHEIRTTGGYIATTAEMSDLEIVSRALMIANGKIEQRNRQTDQQEKIKRLETKTRCFDSILSGKNCLSVTQISTAYGMTAKEFNLMLQSLRI